MGSYCKIYYDNDNNNSAINIILSITAIFHITYNIIFLVIFFILAIDWDHIVKSTPPMKPSAKDINTATQSEIGSFQDDRISKKIILTDEDHKTYEKWEFISKRSFQEEVVNFLTLEEKLVSEDFYSFIFEIFFTSESFFYFYFFLYLCFFSLVYLFIFFIYFLISCYFLFAYSHIFIIYTLFIYFSHRVQ